MEKTFSDKVEPYIKRDVSLLDVGDILVADRHKLAFQVIIRLQASLVERLWLAFWTGNQQH